MLGRFGIRAAIAAASVVLSWGSAYAVQDTSACPITDYDGFVKALKGAAAADASGLNNNFWAVVVNREGTVCAVAYSGADTPDQWLLSRQIAAAKAFTANGLSQKDHPTASGALYGWVQPNVNTTGVPLYGVHGGNVLSEVVYADVPGSYANFGQGRNATAPYSNNNDPMNTHRVGGFINFGGGLALYNSSGDVIGGLGLSGDTACADHSTAWRLRSNANANASTPLNLAPAADDRIALSSNPGRHPRCYNDTATQGATFPVR